MTSRLGPPAIFVLLAAALVVALAYGVALPVLPLLLERRLGSGPDVAWHVGLLTGVYTFATFLFAPLWGWLSDRTGRRRIILLGLTGFAAALAIFAFIDNLAAIYAGRFLSGAFAAAIAPVSFAIAAEHAPSDRLRARYFVWLNIASIGGALGGPAIGGFIGGMWRTGMPPSGAPFLLLALAGGLIAAIGSRILPTHEVREEPGSETVPRRSSLLRLLMLLSFLSTWAIGTFEVGLTLRSQADFGLAEKALGMMFVECMVVMAVAQVITFNPWVPPRLSRNLLAPSFGLLAVAIFLLGFVNGRAAFEWAIAGVAASAGILSPVISYWVSLVAGKVQGAQLGRQSAAASLGQAGGSAAAGLLFAAPWGGTAFVLAALLTVGGAIVAALLSSRLANAPSGRLASAVPGRA